MRGLRAAAASTPPSLFSTAAMRAVRPQQNRSRAVPRPAQRHLSRRAGGGSCRGDAGAAATWATRRRPRRRGGQTRRRAAASAPATARQGVRRRAGAARPARGEKPPMTTSEIRSTTAAASDAMGSTAAGASGSGSGSGSDGAGGWVRASSESRRLSSSSARVERGDVGQWVAAARRLTSAARRPAVRSRAGARRSAFVIGGRCERVAHGAVVWWRRRVVGVHIPTGRALCFPDSTLPPAEFLASSCESLRGLNASEFCSSSALYAASAQRVGCLLASVLLSLAKTAGLVLLYV